MIFPGLGIQEAVIILAILIVITFHLAMLVNMLKNKNLKPLHKALWSLAIIFLPVVGALVYRFNAYAK